MKKLLLFAAVTLGLAGAAVSQETVSISTSTIDAAARFEIIQPGYDRALTFRLDKFTGMVHKLGTCPKDDSIRQQQMLEGNDRP